MHCHAGALLVAKALFAMLPVFTGVMAAAGEPPQEEGTD